ncbi:MAG: family N-acetyltransferase [Firmicutes bacterium]|nr:family N-acetyltransferase [Bacillota bacterium]
MIDLKKKPTLVGDKIVLRPFQEDDFSYMEECLMDPEVMKFTGSDSDYDRDFVLEWYNTRNIQEDRLDLAIVDKHRQVPVGEVVINLYDEKKHSMNFRILIGPRGRDQGFGSEATKLMIDYIFRNTDLKQITLGVYAFNARARRVYEKIGFELESIDKDDLEYEGELIDAYNMVLTRERWLIM